MALIYATTGDLLAVMTEKEMYEVTTESGDEPDEGLLDGALTRAQGLVDSKIGVKYAVPVQTSTGVTPDEVKNATIMIGRYYLYSRRVPPDHVRMAYMDALDWLNDVARGTAVINLVVDGVAENNTGVTVASGQSSRSGVAFSYLRT